MSYYFTTKLDSNFEAATERVTEKLKSKGFGVLTEIDVQTVLKNKIDVDFYKYKILGACNPHFAHKALLKEDKVGTMLPCNVIIQQKSEKGPVEVSAVDPSASMSSIQNEELSSIAQEVRDSLKSVINELKTAP